MEFEWDSKKNQRDVPVQGIDFNDAKSTFYKSMLHKVDGCKKNPVATAASIIIDFDLTN